MSNWAYKVNIKQYLSEEETKEAMQRVYNGVSAETRGLPIPPPTQFDKYAKLAIKNNDINLFNQMAMNSLYDWADHYRVWLGAL